MLNEVLYLKPYPMIQLNYQRIEGNVLHDI